jgi:hypothetical protein
VITVSGVPYAHYDVYAYVGSDANNRSGRSRLFGFAGNDRWFRTNTSPFTGFVEATATTQPTSNMGLANYTHYRTLSSSSFEIRLMRGSNNVGLHGIQIVETDGSVPPNWSWSADFDEDGDVDGSDLARWKSGFGAPSPAHMQGDADSDGDADGSDFLAWQRQLGSAGSVAGAATVPEPATLLLIVSGVLAMLFQRRVAV